MIPTFVRRISIPESNSAPKSVQYTLSLTAEERTRSRFQFQNDDGQMIYLNLPRGTTLRDGDWIETENGELASIHAKPEPVLTVIAKSSLDLLKAAYHLGNRHVPLEMTETYLRLSADPVLQHLLEHRGLQVIHETAPFHPEVGAYGHSH